jgi:hypothetical protein
MCNWGCGCEHDHLIKHSKIWDVVQVALGLCEWTAPAAGNTCQPHQYPPERSSGTPECHWYRLGS